MNWKVSSKWFSQTLQNTSSPWYKYPHQLLQLYTAQNSTPCQTLHRSDPTFQTNCLSSVIEMQQYHWSVKMKIHTSGSNEFFPLKKTFILDLFQKLKSILIGTFPSWFLTPLGICLYDSLSGEKVCSQKLQNLLILKTRLFTILQFFLRPLPFFPGQTRSLTRG